MIAVVKSILTNVANFARQSLVFTVAFSLVLQPIFYNIALADPSNIIPDGTTATTIDLSPNNITVVNIATPTQSGTSMNNFDRFNVDQTGAIMNNSSVVVNTQLGGWIYANPHLANGNQASVIVGEVTGNMPSSLLGYTEIAGGKAEFILLNPNGIMASNAGFINIGQLTLATGSGIYNADGSLASVNMGTGGFSVSGNGFDGTLVDYFRVISKNIQLSAPIWAKDELAIYQGSSNFSTSTNTFSGTANPNSDQTVGIDVSAMGAMYAGKATLVASDLGLGVNIASDVIASNGGITITANGDIVYDNALLNAKGDIDITSNQNTNLTKTNIFAQNGNVNINTQNGTNASNSTIISSKNTTINSSGIFNNNGYILSFDSANLTNFSNQNGYLEAGTSVLITNNNFGLNNSGGTIQSDGGNATINSNYQFNNTNGQINSASDINLNIKANQNYTDTNSKINAGGNVYLNSTGYDIIEGSGVKFKTSNLFQVKASNFTNNSDINVGYIDFAVSNALTNNANLISTNDSQYIIRKNITNTGTIASGATLLLQGANITNTNVGGSTGLIYSAGNMEVAGSTSITNNTNSAIVSGGTLGIYADTLITNGSNAQMWSVGNLTLAGYGNTSVAIFNNGSTSGAAYLKSQGNMQINADQINNIGKDNAPLIEGTSDIIGNNTNAYIVYYEDRGWPEVDAPPKLEYVETAQNLLTSTNSQIIASGSMLINGNILNQTGDILTGANLTINGNITNNVTQYTTRYLLQGWHKRSCSGWFCSGVDHSYFYTNAPVTFSSLTPSRIAAGGNLTISGSQISNDSGTATFQNNTPLGDSSGGTNAGYSGSYATSFINSNNLNSSNLASPNLNLNSLTNPALFSINPNPPSLNLTNANGQNINFTYLYEANPLFNQQNNFLTSDYFFAHLDYNPSRQIIMIGDPYTERRIIEDTISKTGMIQYLGNGAIDGLYANGLRYLEGSSTQVGYALTQSQIESLQEDIIIPVEKDIDGKIVMVPQVYWSSATLAKAKELDKAGGQIYAGGDLTITANGDLTNKGYIASGGNTSILVQGDLNNIGGEITSSEKMILSGQNVLMDALITNESLKRNFFFFTDEVGTLSQVQNVSKIDAGGSLIINAINDFTAKGASIKAKDDAQIVAGGDVMLTGAYSDSSLDLTDLKETSSKSVNTIIQTGTEDATIKLIQKAENDQKIQDINVELARLKYLQQEQTEDSRLFRAALGLPPVDSQINDKQKQVADLKAENQTLISSTANTTGGDVTIIAGKNVNIEAGTDTKTYYYHTEDIGFFSAEATTINTQSQQAISSLVSGNNVNISSNQDINILASIITGGGDGNIVANNNLNIKSGLNEYYSMYYHMEAEMDIGAVVVGAASGAAGGFIVGGPAGAIGGGIGGAVAGSQQFNVDTTTNTVLVATNVGSVLLMKGDLTISAYKPTVEASEIKSDTLAVDIQDGDKGNGYGGLDLQSGHDTSVLVHETFEQRTDYVTFAIVQGVKGAITTYAGRVADGLTFKGFSTIVGIVYTAATYDDNRDGKLSLEQKLYTDQDITRSEYSNTTEVSSSVLFNNLIVR